MSQPTTTPAIRWTPRARRLGDLAGWASILALGVLIGSAAGTWLG